MKLHHVLVAIIAATSFVNCSKNSDPEPPKGTLIFKNTSLNPYQVFVNGKSVIGMQPGQTTQSLPYNAGAVSIKVLQLEGYILYPTEKTFLGTLKVGGSLMTTFP